MCMFGAEFKKPTKVFANLEGLKDLNRLCNHNFRHEQLQGKVQVLEQGRLVWRNRTSIAGGYPTEFCKFVAHAVARIGGASLLGDAPPWFQQWEEELKIAAAPDVLRKHAVARSKRGRRADDVGLRQLSLEEENKLLEGRARAGQ
eukprot:2298394-Karenia_brevis.AAC.1